METGAHPIGSLFLISLPLGPSPASRYNKYMNKKIFVIIAVPFLAASCRAQPSPAPSVSTAMTAPYTQAMSIGNQTIFVQVVTTDRDMQQGLSGRDPLLDDQGMLFAWPKGSQKNPGFWMKEMKFDLDLIWIKDEKIIGITANVTKPSPGQNNLPSHFPPSPVDSILEVNAGWGERNRVKIGDTTELIQK